MPHAYPPVFGGVETQIRRVSECMVQQGHEVRIFTTDVPSVEGYYVPMARINAPPHEIMNGVFVTRTSFGSQVSRTIWAALNRVPLPRGTGRAKGFLIAQTCSKLAAALQEHIRSWRPDVVLATPHLVTNVHVVLRVREVLKFPLVMMPLLHESTPHWPGVAVKIALKSADAVLANTNWEAERLSRHYDVPRQRVFIGGMGVDIPAADERPKGDEFTVTFLGRRSLAKGIPLLFEAMNIVWHCAPDVNLIVAGAETTDEGEIRSLISALPACRRNRVVSASNISEAEKHAILESSNLLVLPSSNESFGGVILEAWSHRVPVATLDLPIFREIISGGMDGFLLANAAEAFAGCVLSGYGNRAKLRSFGEAGLEKVCQQHKWDDVANRFVDAYRFAVASPRWTQ